jgi:hypothetical protein
VLDCVLDRLGGCWCVPLEDADEPVESVEAWRSGEGDAVWWPSRVRGVYDE